MRDCDGCHVPHRLNQLAVQDDGRELCAACAEGEASIADTEASDYAEALR